MLLALQSPQQDPSPREFPFPINPHHHHHHTNPHPLAHHQQPLQSPQPTQIVPQFRLPEQPAMTLCPPPSTAHSRRRPKLSLTIDQTTRRSFSSARANSSAARVPQTAMSPTSRNTLANANLSVHSTNLHRGYSSACTPRGCYDEMDQTQSDSSASPSSSSSSSDDDETVASDTSNSQLSHKEKKRQRRSYKAKHPTLKTCHHNHGSNAFSFLPMPQPSKRGVSPSDRRVRFADEHTVIPREPESESEEEEGEAMTMMERIVELEKLRSTVEGSDDEKEGVGKEVGGWMYKLGRKEYDEISEMEDAAAIPVPTTPTEPSTPSYSNVGFGFGSGI